MIAVLGIRDDKSVTDDLFSKLWHFCIEGPPLIYTESDRIESSIFYKW